MKLYENSYYKDDIKRALGNADLSAFYGKSILITGATGLICSAIVDLIHEANLVCNSKISVVLATRSPEKAKERFAPSEYISHVFYDAMKDIGIDAKVDYIIHGAGNANPKLYVSNPVETMCMNFEAMHRLLDFAKKTSVRKLLYISSSEVYGTKESSEPYKETDCGYAELLSVRSSYPISKRATETLCHSYSKQYGTNVVIARPGHIFGPTASENDNRISSDFAFKAARGEALVMKSSGLQKRSYMYCLDCAVAILKVLENGSSGEAYNICATDTTTVREMASILADAGKVELICNEPTKDELTAFNPMNNSSLCADKLYSLGFKSVFSAAEGLNHTVNILKNTNKKRSE